LIAASGDGLLRGWDLANGRELPAIQAHDDEITALAFSADGDTLASAGADRIVRIWNSRLRLRHSLRGHERVIRAIAFAPDGRSLASIDDQTILLWDTATGRIIQRRETPSGAFRGVVFSSDGEALITASNSQPTPSEVRFWNLSESTGKIVRRQQVQLTSLTLSPDGAKIAATDDRGSVQLWSET
jgi:WD40 repeat protein